MKIGCGIAVPGGSLSHEMLIYAAQCDDLAERSAAAFSSVIRERPSVCGNDSAHTPEHSKEYPPLLATLQGDLTSIDRGLAEIQDTIDRNEL
jgi:hypothetical protein